MKSLTSIMILLVPFLASCKRNSTQVTGAQPKYVAPSTQRQALDVTIDIDDDVWRSRGRLKPANIAGYMRQLKRLGIRRVYWLETPEQILTGSALRDDHDGLAAIRDVVRAAHDAQMEIYAIFKPFETRGYVTAPHPVRLPPQKNTEDMLIGRTYGKPSFLLDHPSLRMHRKPSGDKDEGPISTIRLWAQDNAPVKFGASDIEIWTSPINGEFQRYEEGFSFAESSEKRNGESVRVVTLSGLEIGDANRYVLVRCQRRERGGAFRNRTLQLIEFQGPTGRTIPCTGDQGVYARAEATEIQQRAWLAQNGTWGIPEEFRLPPAYGESLLQSGFKFEIAGSSPLRAFDGDGPVDGYVAAVRGHLEALDTLQPLYPEVRAYWMSQVIALVKSGIDGMDFRVDNHAAWVSEPLAYGFDPPVIEAYRRRYGVDIRTEPFDVQKWKAVQGDAYTDFLREARAYTRQQGVKMQVHVNALMGNVVPSWEINNVPANIEWQWQRWIREDLADSVLLKLLPWWWGAQAGAGSEFALEVAELARQHGKPVSCEWRFDTYWLVSSGPGGKQLSQEDVDKIVSRSIWGWDRKEISAVVLYEGFDFVYLDTGTGEALVSPAFEQILAAVRAGTGNNLKAADLTTDVRQVISPTGVPSLPARQDAR